jgi:hypothetical protein
MNCKKSRYDILLEKHAKHPINSFVRLDNTLLREKKNATLYYETDSHWNEYAAFFISKSILQKLFGNRWRSHLPLFKFTEADISGGTAFDVMGLTFTEKTLHMETLNYPSTVINKKGPLVSVSDDSYDKVTRTDIVFRGSNPIWHYSLKKHYASDSMPSAIFYSDSYAVSLIQYIVYSFANLDIYRTFDITTMEGIENLKSYDIIMLEAAERVMRHINIDLGRVMSGLGKDTIASAAFKIDLSTVIPFSDIKANAVADQLHVELSGKSPLLSFSSLPASDNKTFRILKLSIDSAKPANLEVFHGEANLAPEKQPDQVILIAEGLHNVYIPLPFEKKRPLFLKSGVDLDSYILQSAEILEFSGTY